MASYPDLNPFFSSTILKKGESYFKSGAVGNLLRISNNVWEAEVEGTETYTVRIEWDSNGFSSGACTCPYMDQYDGYCKHIAAVCIQILKEGVEIKKEESLENSFGQQLKKISSAKLKEALLIKAMENPLFRETLSEILEESLPSEGKKSRKDPGKALKSVFSRMSDRGFLHYRDSFRFAQEAFASIEKVMVARDKPLKKLSHLISLTRTLSHAMSHGDDSAGVIGECIYACFDCIEDMIMALETSANLEQAYKQLLSFSQDKELAGWDWPEVMLTFCLICVEKNTSLGSGYLEHLVQLQDQIQGDDFSTNFQRTRLRLLEAKARDQIQPEFSYTDFLLEHRKERWAMEALIERLHEEEDWERMLEVLEEYLSENPRDWRMENLQFELWDKLGKTERAISWAKKELIRNPRRMEYFDYLKSQESPKSWTTTFEELVREVWSQAHKTGIDPSELLCNWYSREGLGDKIFETISNSPSLALIQRYREELVSEDKLQTLELLAEILPHEMDLANNRKAYRTLAKHLKWMSKNGGEVLSESLITELKQKYPRRKAMIEELNKVSQK